uniref:DUF7918 domain-containing protein n=1 Tax=Mycena chlorophos TaxID=658473 RepID=A0ABQ0L6X4_MYCCL|nr:predicted protein [Mycena chlorophos]
MPQHNGFHAWISIDGQPAPEYSVEVSEDGTNVTCWVASELGKKFSDTSPSTAPPTGGKALYVQDIGTRVAEISGVTDGTNLRPFVFSSLEISDDDSLLGGPSHADLGLIALEIIPVRLGATIPKASAGPSALAQKLKVHERAKKAVTQQVGLGQAEPSQPSHVIASALAGPTVVKFSWRYRPLDVLRANGIAPPATDASAAPTTLKRKAEDDGSGSRPAKMEKEVFKNKSNVSGSSPSTSNTSTNKKPRVKNEKEDVIDLAQHKSDSKVKTVKTKNKSQGVARRTYAKGEVIDLT